MPTANFLALLTATPNDPRRTDLRAGIDALVRSRPAIDTTNGTFTREELMHAGLIDRR